QKETRELIANSLYSFGFNIFMAPGGREGIQVAKTKKPDVILLDMVMPRFDGIQTCKVLKRMSDTKDIPIIFLTANRNVEDVKKAMQAGGADYIVKPFDPEIMMQRIFKAASVIGRKEFDPSSVIKRKDP
ncbi:PleD family two-component system response regulator, partial [candidate division KSB1 bacterium]